MATAEDTSVTGGLKVEKLTIDNYHSWKCPMNGPEKVKVELKDVLCVPKIQNKLMSLPSMTEKGATVKFKGQLCTIFIDGKSYQIGHKQGKLYKLNSCPEDAACCFTNSNDKENSMSLWYLRYGHAWIDNMKLLNNKAMVDGLKVYSDDFDRQEREGCAMGKMHRNPFPKKSEHKITQQLEVIHSDVCGPMSVNLVGGPRYFVTFIDDFPRFSHVYIIKHRSDVLEKFKEFVELTENLMGYRVKALR